MKIKKLGIEWGAAYLEATPVRIFNEEAAIEVFEGEGGDIIIEVPPSACIRVGTDRNGRQVFTITVEDKLD